MLTSLTDDIEKQIIMLMNSNSNSTPWTNEETHKLLQLVQFEHFSGNWDDIAHQMYERGFPRRSGYEYENKLQNQTTQSRVVSWSPFELHLLCNIIRKTYDDERYIDWKEVVKLMMEQTGISRSVGAYRQKWRDIRAQCAQAPPIRIKIEDVHGNVQPIRHSLLERDEELDLDEDDILDKLPRTFSYILGILGPDWYGQHSRIEAGEFEVHVDLNSRAHKARYFSPGEALKQLSRNKEHGDEGDVENLWAWIQGIRQHITKFQGKKFVPLYPSDMVVFLVNPRSPTQLTPSAPSFPNLPRLLNPYSFRGLQPGDKIYPFISSRGFDISEKALGKDNEDED
jgi:hypothetical protein